MMDSRSRAVAPCSPRASAQPVEVHLSWKWMAFSFVGLLGCTAGTSGGGLGDVAPMDVSSGAPDVPAAAAVETASPPAATCTDTLKNGDETDADCGGAKCPACALGRACKVDGDCATGKCKAQGCVKPLGALIGTGDGTPTSVTLTVIETTKLNDPADLEFDPKEPTRLWVVNRKTDALTLITHPGTPQQTTQAFLDFSMHFLEEVVSLSFSGSGVFSTCGDTRNTYDGLALPNDFMGPALWPADPADYAKYGPDASAVHLDMLHNTPYCMGVLSAGDNAVWVVNGLGGSLDWYDFRVPHPHGTDNHVDGTKRRYAGIGLKRLASVPSHLVAGPDGELYIADAGNARVVRVDTASSTYAGKKATYPDEQPIETYTGSTVTVIVDPTLGVVFAPSGLALHEGYLYVSDYANGLLTAFSLDGKRRNVLDTGLGEKALGGLTIGPDGRLWLVDRVSNRVLRLDP